MLVYRTPWHGRRADWSDLDDLVGQLVRARRQRFRRSLARARSQTDTHLV